MLAMNLTKMIIMMFRHCVSDLAWLYQLSTKDLLEKVLSDPLHEDICQRHCRDLETSRAKFVKDQSGGILTLEIETHIPALINSDEAKKWRAINDRIPKLPSLTFISEADEQVVPPFRRQLDLRLKRQFERMRQAKIWQSMPPHQIVTLSEPEPQLTV
jgi:hypothetical protein